MKFITIKGKDQIIISTNPERADFLFTTKQTDTNQQIEIQRIRNFTSFPYTNLTLNKGEDVDHAVMEEISKKLGLYEEVPDFHEEADLIHVNFRFRNRTNRGFLS